MASKTAPPAPQLVQADLQAALRSRMIQNGEYTKVLDALKSKLDEAGWEDQVRDLAREKARTQDPPSLQQLATEVEPAALDLIPADVRAEVEAMVRAFVEKSIE